MLKTKCSLWKLNSQKYAVLRVIFMFNESIYYTMSVILDINSNILPFAYLRYIFSPLGAVIILLPSILNHSQHLHNISSQLNKNAQIRVRKTKRIIRDSRFKSRNMEFKKRVSRFGDSLSKLTSQIIHMNLSIFATVNYFGGCLASK